MTVNAVAENVLATEKVSVCETELPYVWTVNGKSLSYNATGIYYDTLAVDCSKTISVLDLTVNAVAETVLSPEVVSICEKDLPYVWSVNGKSYNATDIYYDTVEVNCTRTISVLDLTILPDVVYEPTETDYFCPGSTYDWRGHSFNAPGTYTHTIQNALGCDSIVYTLELLQYVNSLPAITADDIIAICGYAINVTNADAIIQLHIANEPLYASNAVVTWYVLSGNTYEELTNTAIDGTITEVTLKYTVTTDCGVVESDPITVQVEQPTPENDPNMTNVPAVSKYGDRIIVIDLRYIDDNFGWAVEENDVTWYRVVGSLDDYADPNAVMDDEVLGHGYYYSLEDGNPLPEGLYYARIVHDPVSAADCAGILQTNLLNVVSLKSAPKLVPNITEPAELIRLMNLDPSVVSNITVYTATGEVLNTYQVKDEEMTFNAAHMAGYYIVEIQTESGKISLRYVVK